MSDTESITLAQHLTDSGLRSTPQREVIYQVILAKRDHPTAEEIFARVKLLMPTISFATVYNCLDTLVQCGLIKQVNFVREPTRYCPNLHEHAHGQSDAHGYPHGYPHTFGYLYPNLHPDEHHHFHPDIH